MRLLLISLLISLLVTLVVSKYITVAQQVQCADTEYLTSFSLLPDPAMSSSIPDCDPLPCGITLDNCTDGNISCQDGQYRIVETFILEHFLVNPRAQYKGGTVNEEDKYGNGGAEYNFIANILAEKRNFRVNVSRAKCRK
ncbi:hypothetical protein PRIPAC_89254 [Pristionchus pacificus]|uniref:Uncharacterized protein n=1 Tax=Pristionchus pacificus TaxID=54126 RepID=A0A2A6CZG5_PRIPA|nr:hypothetical protein PRIPAC_89254 [Pristionchus pacificus]|eukprot:PDM83500.1 hypothetical protein PRIPAC_35132 [Pristionchus pacificus]